MLCRWGSGTRKFGNKRVAKDQIFNLSTDEGHSRFLCSIQRTVFVAVVVVFLRPHNVTGKKGSFSSIADYFNRLKNTNKTKNAHYGKVKRLHILPAR